VDGVDIVDRVGNNFGRVRLLPNRELPINERLGGSLALPG